eukprot:9100802-Heterocapsa_arctica.AAC.1
MSYAEDVGALLGFACKLGRPVCTRGEQPSTPQRLMPSRDGYLQHLAREAQRYARICRIRRAR